MREKIFIVSVKIHDDECPTFDWEIEEFLHKGYSGRIDDKTHLEVKVFNTFQGNLLRPSEVISCKFAMESCE